MSQELLPFAQSNPDQALYQQIATWINRNIEAGKFAAGDQMPTVRVLATHLGLNRGSIASAYSYLTKTGVLQARVGRGTFVRQVNDADQQPIASTITGEEFWQPLLAEAATRIGLGNPTALDIGLDTKWIPDRGEASERRLHLPVDMPLADHHLSYDLIRDTLADISQDLPRESLAYGHPQGSYDLRVQLSALAEEQNIRVDPSHIMVCNGAQQALSLLTSLLVQPGDTIIVENPSYPGAIRAFRMARAKVIGIPLDSDGMRVDVLEGILRNHRAKFIYTIPSFQAPTGITLTQERREQLYRLAQKYQVPILEDEYVNSLYYDEPPPPPIKAMDTSQLVAYIGTFSKTLGASMRLGWIAAHPSLVSRLVQAKEIHDIHSSVFSQLIAERILRDGGYKSLLHTLREHYGSRYHAMRKHMSKTLDLALITPKNPGGFSIWGELPGDVTATEWLVYAKARGVPFDLGAPYFLGIERDRYVRLCFSLLTTSEISKAATILRESLTETRLQQYGGSGRTDRFLPFA